MRPLGPARTVIGVRSAANKRWNRSPAQSGPGPTLAICYAPRSHGPVRAGQLVPTPDPGGVGEAINQLNAVMCTAATNCWAVGVVANPPGSGGEALHWNGAEWSTG